jgi:hypothetical protein
MRATCRNCADPADPWSLVADPCSLNPDLSERCEPSIRWFRGEARDSPIAASDLPLPDLPLPSGR